MLKVETVEVVPTAQAWNEEVLPDERINILKVETVETMSTSGSQEDHVRVCASSVQTLEKAAASGNSVPPASLAMRVPQVLMKGKRR